MISSHLCCRVEQGCWLAGSCMCLNDLENITERWIAGQELQPQRVGLFQSHVLRDNLCQGLQPSRHLPHAFEQFLGLSAAQKIDAVELLVLMKPFSQLRSQLEHHRCVFIEQSPKTRPVMMVARLHTSANSTAWRCAPINEQFKGVESKLAARIALRTHICQQLRPYRLKDLAVLVNFKSARYWRTTTANSLAPTLLRASIILSKMVDEACQDTVMGKMLDATSLRHSMTCD
jgi:hypothetical protein